MARPERAGRPQQGWPAGRVGLRVLAVLTLPVLLTGCVGSRPGPGESPSSSGSASAVGGATLPDFDGDGAADLVVGVGEASGRVTIRYADGRTQDVRRTELDGSDSASFGRSLLARDLDGDGITDLVIGDPGSDGSAAVFLVRGSQAGLDLEHAVVQAAPSGLHAFGQALAVVDGASTLLAVGAPGEPAVTGASTTSPDGSPRPSGASVGGAVAIWTLDSSGNPHGTPRILTQESLGLSDARAGDAMGSTLAATGNWLAIGAPRKDVAKVRDAGAVLVLEPAADEATVTQLSEGRDGVPGTARAEDRFGFALAAGDGYLAVGAPLDDEDGSNAGLVQPFRMDAVGPVPMDPIRPSSLASDDPAGGLFGFSLASAHPCPGTPGLVVGAPGTPTAGVSTAGAAWLVPLAATQCPTRELIEGGALGGAPTEMASLGLATSAWTTHGDSADTVVLTAPGNDEEGIPGRVLALAPPYDGPATVLLDGLRLHEEGTLTLSPAMR